MIFPMITDDHRWSVFAESLTLYSHSRWYRWYRWFLQHSPLCVCRCVTRLDSALPCQCLSSLFSIKFFLISSVSSGSSGMAIRGKAFSKTPIIGIIGNYRWSSGISSGIIGNDSLAGAIARLAEANFERSQQVASDHRVKSWERSQQVGIGSSGQILRAIAASGHRIIWAEANFERSQQAELSLKLLGKR